jgi:hypothetical protein
VVRGGAFGRTEASPRRKNSTGSPNLSVFLRFFNAMVFFAGFQSAGISNFIRTLTAPARPSAPWGGSANVIILYSGRDFLTRRLAQPAGQIDRRIGIEMADTATMH